jgi:hypothetical protein
MENNTNACRLVGEGTEHHKAPQTNNNNPKKKKKEKRKAPTTVIAPQPCKVDSNKRKQQGPNQRENTNKLKCTPGPQRTNPGQANITNNPQTKEPTKTTEPMNNIYASPMITKLHPKHRRNQKHTRNMRLQIRKHSTCNLQTLNNKQGIQNETMASKLNLKQ